MSATIDTTGTKPKRILMVAASPMTSPTTGWPIGFWASELTHPYTVFHEAGYEIELASPEGGRLEMDGYSDPRHESGYSADDLISMGFIHTPSLMTLLEGTKPLTNVNPNDYDAIFVIGGQAPMFQFRENAALQKLLTAFYESEKPTAAICHGTASLIDVKLSDGSYLVEGKTMTGFANVEEGYADQFAGTKVFPWHIEDAAKERGANYIQGGLWKSFAVRDGRLITGQQQYSGAKAAELLVQALGQ